MKHDILVVFTNGRREEFDADGYVLTDIGLHYSQGDVIRFYPMHQIALVDFKAGTMDSFIPQAVRSGGETLQ